MPKGIADAANKFTGPGILGFDYKKWTPLGWGSKDNVVTDTVKSIGDTFSPDFPEPKELETPDPVAQQSALAATQAEERSLINRAGLQTTKKVQNSLLRQKGRQTLGGTSV